MLLLSPRKQAALALCRAYTILCLSDFKKSSCVWNLLWKSNKFFCFLQLQSTVKKKMATDTFTYNALRTETLKERIKTQRKIVSHSNSTRAMLLI